MTGQLERRFIVEELRASDGSKGRMLRGYAAIFNKWVDIGWFREMILPGAFAETIKKDDIRALFNHDSNLVLGRVKPGTLRLSEDEKGLLCEIDPPDTNDGRDVVTLVERGDVSQMSFGFRTLTDTWGHEDGKLTRVLKKATLFDVSPVTFPAYPQTSVSARGMLSEAGISIEPIERALFCARNGIPMLADDRAALEAIRPMIDQALMPSEAASNENLKRRLDLAARLAG